MSENVDRGFSTYDQYTAYRNDSFHIYLREAGAFADFKCEDIWRFLRSDDMGSRDLSPTLDLCSCLREQELIKQYESFTFC